MLVMKFFFLLFLHSLVKTWPYYRSQAPAHHCCRNLIRERTLTLAVSCFLIVLVKQSLKEGTQWLQRIFLRKWNKKEVRIHGNVTGYHGFHPEFWKNRITSKLCSEKNSCLVQRHEKWYKTLVQSLWGKNRGTQIVTVSFNEPPHGEGLLLGELVPLNCESDNGVPPHAFRLGRAPRLPEKRLHKASSPWTLLGT